MVGSARVYTKVSTDSPSNEERTTRGTSGDLPTAQLLFFSSGGPEKRAEGVSEEPEEWRGRVTKHQSITFHCSHRDLQESQFGTPCDKRCCGRPDGQTEAQQVHPGRGRTKLSSAKSFHLCLLMLSSLTASLSLSNMSSCSFPLGSVMKRENSSWSVSQATWV